MMKSFLNFKVLFVLILFTGFMSCEKEDTITDNLTDDTNVDNIDLRELTEEIAELDFSENDNSNPERPFGGFRCFTPVFPVTIVFPDASTQDIDSKEALRTALKDWKQNNPDVEGHPEFQFPFDATLQDGTVVTFNSKEEMRSTLKDCSGDKHHKGRFGKCFKPVFPVTIIFPDGSTQEVDSKVAMETAIMDWKQNNPDVEGHPEFQFPFDVKLKDSTQVTVNNKDELREIVKGCAKDRKHKPGFGKCFKIVFPISIEFPDGTTEEVGSKEDLRTILMDWRQNNPDATERPQIVFPFEVTTRQGNTITINNKDELIKLLKKCRGKKGKGKGGRGSRG